MKKILLDSIEIFSFYFVNSKEIVHCISDQNFSEKMSNETDYFPRGSTTTKKESSSEKPRINRVDRNDLFLTTSNKRKRSRENSQKLKVEQKKKKKKSLDGEDHQNTLYRRLHKQVRFFPSLFKICSILFIESDRWDVDLWLY